MVDSCQACVITLDRLGVSSLSKIVRLKSPIVLSGSYPDSIVAKATYLRLSSPPASKTICLLRVHVQ